MNSSAIYSKTGKGVQEASGKTSHLSRADRAVLAAIDGKTSMGEVAKKFDKLSAAKFDALIQQFDKDGFVREVSSGGPSVTTARPTPAKAAPPPPKTSPTDDADEALDFTQALKLPPKTPAPAAPKPPPMDLAAAARADVERKAKDQELDYKARHEAELKARAAADEKAKAEAEARARAAGEAKARAEAQAKAHAESEAKTRADAEARVKAAREAAVRIATEAKAKAEADAKAKTEAAERRAAEAAEQARKDLEEKAKRDAEELRRRLEAEMNAKLDAERKARDEEDRKRREEEDRKRKEEDERRAKEDSERRAVEEAERKKREEEERKRKEEDEHRRKEEDERRAKEAAERKAREDEENRKRKEEAGRRTKEEAEQRARDETERNKRDDEERKRREDEDRRRKEEDERRAKNEAEREARDDAERKAKEDAARRAKDEADAKARAAASASPPVIDPAPVPAAAASGALGDDLLADLESFGKRDEEEQKAREEAERQAKEAAARKAKEEADRRAKEDAQRRAEEEAERKAREDAERAAREEEERREREEEERRAQEEAERKRKEKEARAAKRAPKAATGRVSDKGDDDVDVKDEDFDLDEIKRDQKVLTGRAAVLEQPSSAVVAASGRPKRWGRPVAIVLFVLLLGGIGVLHVMPLSTPDYEKSASEALGAPVKIGSARLSLVTGIELKFENVAIGNAVKIRLVRGFPEIGSLFGERKSFSRIELEGATLPQSKIADALFGKAAGANFRVGRVTAKQLNLDGPLKVPPLDVDAVVSGDGSLQSVRLSGVDQLLVQLSPKGSELAFEISAGSLALPFVPALSLSEFAMKGTANRDGVTRSEFDGRAFDGIISGTAQIKWGANWDVQGEVRARAVKVAVFAPALVSDGKVDGRATYAMSGDLPGLLFERARMQGDFKIERGVLGSFDLTRALQTGGAQSAGRTVFTELKGQGVYDKGTVQLRDVSISAGTMNAGASVDIDASGGISGRIAADVKTANQTLRAVLNISGKVQDPVIRK